MRRLTITVLAACLLGVGATPAIAQESSSPPWFGGRVEMPEHGVAITIPDDWIAFDLTADTDEQVDIVYQLMGDQSEVRSDVPKAWLRWYASAHGEALLVARTLDGSVICQVSDIPVVMSYPDTFPEWALGEMAGPSTCGSIDDEAVPMELPAGPALVVQGVNVCDGMESEAIHYAITSGDRAAAVGCEAPKAPGDRWLSIVETFEFLPEEGSASTQSPSPGTAETLVRVEVPEAGIALDLPEDWTVEVEMVEMSRVDMEEGQLISTSILIAYGPARLPSCGLYVGEFPVPALWIPGMLEDLAAGSGPFREGEDHTPSQLDLPAGDAMKVAHISRRQVDMPLGFVEYFIAADDRLYVLFCATLPPLVPDDDWLSIAETFELLPAEE
jgi:hypothetical protein